MHEAELALRMFALKLAVPLHCRAAISADVSNDDAIEEAMIASSASDEPLIRIGDTNLAPLHVVR